jgi:hypothetical protein
MGMPVPEEGFWCRRKGLILGEGSGAGGRVWGPEGLVAPGPQTYKAPGVAQSPSGLNSTVRISSRPPSPTRSCFPVALPSGEAGRSLGPARGARWVRVVNRRSESPALTRPGPG